MPDFPFHLNWENGLSVLGADSALYTDLQPGGVETPVIDVPDDDRIMRVVSDTLGAVVVHNASGVLVTTIELLFDDGDGNRIVVATVASLANGVSAVMSPSILGITSEDGGLFLRFVGGAATGVSVRTKFRDVRNLTRTVTELSTTPTLVTPVNDDPQGCLFNYLSATYAATTMNFDASTPAITGYIEDDAGQQMVVTPTALVASATVPTLPAVEGVMTLPPGWGLFLAVAAVGASPVKVYQFMIQANLAPVKRYQGGAY